MTRTFLRALLLFILIAPQIDVFASDRLTPIPFNESTDRPRLQQDTGISDETIMFLRPGVYSMQEILMSRTSINNFYLALIEITSDAIVMIGWNKEQASYQIREQLFREDILGIALYADDKRRQLQLKTAKGYFAINIYDNAVQGFERSAPTQQAFEVLREMSLPVQQTNGYSDVSVNSPRYIIRYGK